MVVAERSELLAKTPPYLNSLHLVGIEDLNRVYLEKRHFPLMRILEHLDKVEGNLEVLPRKNFRAVVITEQPSTRTVISSELGLQLLGAKVSKIDKPDEVSSMSKRESRYDTRLAFEASRASVIGWRFREAEAVHEVATPDSRLAIINLGNGTDQHPTQATGDFALKTVIRKQNGYPSIDGMTITFARQADTRAIKSEAFGYGLHFSDVHIIFAAPPGLQIGQAERKVLDSFKETSNLTYEVTSDFKGPISISDIVYMGRYRFEDEDNNPAIKGETHHERMESAIKLYNLDKYKIDEETIKLIPPHCRILDCLPNDGEIAQSLKNHPQIWAFDKQMESANYSRMAHFLDRMSPETVDQLLDEYIWLTEAA